MTEAYKEAFTEVNEIIKYLNNDIIKKIPKEFIDNIKENMSTTYKVKYDNTKGINEQNLKQETRAILSVALDRARFKGRASLNPRYLRTDTAKSLIGEARRINERYMELDAQNEKKSVIHIIEEDELKENNNNVSEKEREEATQIINEIMQNKAEKEI